MIVWIDFSDHGYSDTHTVPYWNEVQWNAQYPIGGYKTDHRLDSNKNVRKRVAKEWENYRQKIERGITEKRIFYSLVTGLPPGFCAADKESGGEGISGAELDRKKTVGAYQCVKDSFKIQPEQMDLKGRQRNSNYRCKIVAIILLD